MSRLAQEFVIGLQGFQPALKSDAELTSVGLEVPRGGRPAEMPVGAAANLLASK